MSDTSNNNVEKQFEDEVDEDLLALSPPPPSPRVLVFTVAILILSVVMLGWFLPELRFLTAHFRGPQELGEAADIDMDELSSHSYASLEGFPLVQRTLSFKEGVKWFMMSDNTRKFFPIAGQPNLYVQWAETDAHKAYRDPETNPGVLGPPSHFKGHLLSRKDLGKNYDRVFVFYDCLKYHYLGRCNRCLGKTDAAACRDAFVCAENNDKDTCAALAEKSEEDIEKALEAAKKSGGDTKSLELLKAAKRAHRVSVKAVRLEELSAQADRLRTAAAEKNHPLEADLKEISRALLDLRIGELKIRATNALRTVAALGKKKEQETRTARKELVSLQKKVTEQTAELKTMRIFINIGDELDRLKNRCRALKKSAHLLSEKTLDSLAGFDPKTKKGTDINKAVQALEAAVAEVERARYKAALEAAKKDGDSSVRETAEGETPDGGAQEQPTIPMPPLPPIPQRIETNPSYLKLSANLDGVSMRAESLVDKLKYLLPGVIPAFDKWAVKPDVLGTIPEGLREERVVGALGKLEEMLDKAPSPEERQEDARLLAEAYNEKIDTLEAARKRVQAIEKMPGLAEIRIADQLADLAEQIKERKRVKGAIDQVLADMTSAGLYLGNLKGAPEEMAKLDKLLSPLKLADFESRLNAAAKVLSPGDWVLVDGEIPIDKLWVVAVYLILLIMIIVNLRKVWRFFLAYKE